MYEILLYVDRNDQYAARLKWSEWEDNTPKQCSLEFNCKTLEVQELSLDQLMCFVKDTILGIQSLKKEQ